MTAAVIVVLAAVAAVVVLHRESEKLPEWSFDGTVFKDSKSGIEYAMADMAYQPYSVGNDYARVGAIVISEIPHLDPEKYLVIDLDGDYTVLYNRNSSIPTFAEFEPETIKICRESETIVQIGLVDDEQLVSAISEALLSATSGTPELDGADVYHLKFTSSVHDRLYYDVIYLEGADGNYLYDRSRSRIADAGELLSGYISGEVYAETTADAETTAEADA